MSKERSHQLVMAILVPEVHQSGRPQPHLLQGPGAGPAGAPVSLWGDSPSSDALA